MFQRSNGEFGSTAATILLPDGGGSSNCFLQLHVLRAFAANTGAPVSLSSFSWKESPHSKWKLGLPMTKL